MPWCPKCKLEYQEGIKVCADCGSELVNEISGAEEATEEIVRLENMEDVEKFISFLNYSSIHSTSYSFDETDEAYVVTTTKSDLKEAKKLFQAFLIAESQEEEKPKEEAKQTDVIDETIEASCDTTNAVTYNKTAESTCDLNSVANEPIKKKKEKKSGVYVKKEMQYKDVRSSGQTLLIAGVIGIVFMLLNYFKVFKLYDDPFPLIVMSLIFAFFIIAGFSSLRRSKQIKAEIAEETKATNDILSWLSNTITKELLKEEADTEQSEEMNYFKRTEYMKEKLIDHLGEEINDSYLDYIIDEFYNRLYTE